jgi:hypothetical protein
MHGVREYGAVLHAVLLVGFTGKFVFAMDIGHDAFVKLCNE